MGFTCLYVCGSILLGGFSPFHYLALLHSSKAYHTETLTCHFQCYQAPRSEFSVTWPERKPPKSWSLFQLPPKGSRQNRSRIRASPPGTAVPGLLPGCRTLSHASSLSSYHVCVYLPTHGALECRQMQGRICLNHLCTTPGVWGPCLTGRCLTKTFYMNRCLVLTCRMDTIFAFDL